MNNGPISAIHQRKQNKHIRPTPILSTNTSLSTKEYKSSDQSRILGQTTDNSLTNPTPDSSSMVSNSKRFELENYFDSMLHQMSILPLHAAIEPILTNIYSSYKSILWVSKDLKSYSYYSPTLDLYVKGEDTLLAATARTKTSIISPILCQNKGNRKRDDEEINFEQLESECSKLFFPLYLKSGNIVAIAEIMRTESQNPFDDSDLKIASFLIKKFLLYGSAVFNPSETVFFASEFSHISSSNNIYQKLSSLLARSFNCKMADFWCHHNNSNDLLKLDAESGDFIQPPRSNIGVVTGAIRNKTNINAKSSRYHPNFSFNGDPLPDEPILISTHEIDDCIFATVLRGKKSKSYFSAEEESKLKAVMPFISRSLLFSINVTKKDIQQKDPFEIQLTSLLDSSALFSTQLSFDDLVKVIQERSSSLVNAKSCRFIMYDHLTNQFVFDQEKSNLPGNLGLAGNVASFGSPLRISSPMSDSRYNKKIDFDIHQLENIDSMLIVPIYSSLQSVIGVLSLANKMKNLEFTEEDERIIVAIANLSSISIQNSKIFQSSIKLTQILNSFVRIKNAKISKNINNDKSILIKILNKILDESNAYRATLYLCEEKTTNWTDSSLLIYRSIGCPPEQGTRFSLPAAQQQKQISYPINDDFTERVAVPLSSRIARYTSYNVENYKPHTFSSPSSSKTASISKNNSKTKVDMGTSPSPIQSGRLICCTPILIPTGPDNPEMVGVIEIAANSINTQEEIDNFQSFCNIVVFSIKNQAAKEILKVREEQFSLLENIAENELDLFTVPHKFKTNVPENVFTKDFDITMVDSNYLINITFSIFTKFNLMEEFKITASKLFLFLYRIKSLLNDEKNWRHSIEVTCFLSYVLIITKFAQKVPSYELLSLIIASLCHDLKESTVPFEDLQDSSSLDVLYSKQPVFECFSCIETISFLSDLLENVNEDKIYLCNELIIQLILSTDYYKHYSLVNDFKALISAEREVKLDNQKNRLLILKLLLKCSDVGVITRPSNIADKYKDEICDEFFLHGPYDKAREMVFTSALSKNRSHIDKQRSRKTVLDSVFTPMFRMVTKYFPQLSQALNCLSDNIKKWTGSDKVKLGPDRMLENE